MTNLGFGALHPDYLAYDTHAMGAQSSTKTIGLLAYDDMQALNLVGPLDAFGGANVLAHGAPPYELCIDRIMDVMEELMKFTMLTRDVASYLVDRYSERKESADTLSQRMHQATI